jgi:uncharacterized protein YqeY
MGLAQDLQSKTLELRKQRVDYAAGFQSVLGFAQASAKERGLKGGDGTVNDEDALRAIQKGIKICRDTLEQAGDHTNTDGVLDRTKRELAALETLLPQMASEDEVRDATRPFLTGYFANEGDPKKAMGVLMKHLSDHFGTTLDKSVASRVAREELNNVQA